MLPSTHISATCIMDQSGSFPAPHHAHTCSVTDSNSTADDQTGPGRLVDNALVYLGWHLELTLGKVAVKMGKGPLVTAERILRQRAEILAMTSWHDEYCRCLDCRLRDRFGLNPGSGTVVSRSPAKLKKLTRGVNTDCRRLVNYVRSDKCSTQKQAVDSVLDLSVHDGELRAILKAHRASEAISDLAGVYRRFRFNGPGVNEALLTSSRRALVSLDDGNVNGLLKDWVSIWRQQKIDTSVLHTVWEQISGYLWDRDRAFLVMRVIGTCAQLGQSHELAVHGFLSTSVLGAVASCPSYFDWDECGKLLCCCFEVLYSANRWITNIIDWLFRNVHRMPHTFDEWKDNFLVDDCLGFSFAVEEDIMRGIRESGCNVSTMEVLQDKYPYEILQPALRNLSCPVRTVARSCGRTPHADITPNEDEKRMYSELVRFIDSSDSLLQLQAWKYIDRFLALDIYRCNMMLEALSQTAFGHSDGFYEFEEIQRRNLVPEQNTCNYQKFRYHDSSNNISYCEGYACTFSEPVYTEMMEYDWDWATRSIVERGEAFSRAGLFPFLAGRDKHGNQTYLVCIRSPNFPCGTRSSLFVDSAIKEGTKPEDLRVEVQCRHTKVLRIPNAFFVPVLRYSPEAYAQVLGIDVESLFTTGPFAWKPYQHDREPDLTFRRRVMTTEEAFAMGYTEAEIFPEVESNPNCPTWERSQRLHLGDPVAGPRIKV